MITDEEVDKLLEMEDVSSDGSLASIGTIEKFEQRAEEFYQFQDQLREKRQKEKKEKEEQDKSKFTYKHFNHCSILTLIIIFLGAKRLLKEAKNEEKLQLIDQLLTLGITCFCQSPDYYNEILLQGGDIYETIHHNWSECNITSYNGGPKTPMTEEEAKIMEMEELLEMGFDCQCQSSHYYKRRLIKNKEIYSTVHHHCDYF